MPYYTYILLFILLIVSIWILFMKRQIATNSKIIRQKEARIIQLRNEIDSLDLDNQTVNMALNIIQKNKMLEKIRRKITKFSSQKDFQNCLTELTELDYLLFETLQLDNDIDTFKIFIEKSNQYFYSKLNTKYPNLTNNEQRLCTLIRLDLSSKEIANILNISEKSVEMNRYRLRKKIQIPKSESLSLFIKSI